MLLQVTDFLEYFVAFIAPELAKFVVQGVWPLTALRTVPFLFNCPDAVDVFREDADGDKLYRSWNYYNPAQGQEIYQKYPSDWTAYFSRCEMYLKTPLGKCPNLIGRSTFTLVFTFF